MAKRGRRRGTSPTGAGKSHQARAAGPVEAVESWGPQHRLIVVGAVAIAGMLLLELLVRWQGFEHSPAFVTEPQLKLQRANAAATARGVDVLILGASDIDAGIDPATLDRSAGGATKSFNAALAGLLPENYLLWQTTLETGDVHSTRVLVSLPVLMFLPASEGLANVRAAHSSAVAEGVREANRSRSGLIAKLEQYSVAFDSRSRLGQLDGVASGSWYDSGAGKSAERERDHLAVGISANGWNSRYSERGALTELEGAAKGPLEQPSDGSLDLDFQGVRQMLQRFGDAGIEVAALIPPGSVAESLDSSAYGSTRIALTTELQKWGVPVIDAYEGFSVDDYHDRDHLNQSGARKLSARVGKAIARLCSTDRWSWCEP